MTFARGTTHNPVGLLTGLACFAALCPPAVAHWATLETAGARSAVFTEANATMRMEEDIQVQNLRVQNW